MKFFKSNLTIRTKLLLLNALICGAFFLIVLVIVFSFSKLNSGLKAVINMDMSRAIANAQTARDFSRLSTGIEYLSRSFHDRNDLLRAEYAELTLLAENISKKTTNPALNELILIIERQLDILLNDCTTINILVLEIASIDNEIHTVLTSLEDLISEIIIQRTLKGESTDFAEQMLSLVIGYKQSLLLIGRQFVELSPEHYFDPLGGKTPPVVEAIDDLTLRLQTITASEPNVAHHGRHATRYTERYRDAVLRYDKAMNKLSMTKTDLDHTRALFVTEMERIEKTIIEATQSSARNINNIVFITGSTVIGLMVFVILILGFTTKYLLKSTVTKPMQAILSHIGSLKEDAGAERHIDLGRKDEWAIIEKGLNDMTAELAKSYTSLKKSEMFLNTIVENIPDMIFVKEAEELRFVRFNKAGEDLLGYPRDMLVGKNDHDFFPKEEADFFISKDREVFKKGEMLDIPKETINTRTRGERILHTKKLPLLNDKGQPEYLLGISEDITERLYFERRLKQIEKAESLARMAGAVAHHFNNQLSVVMGSLEMALEDLPPESSGYAEVLKEAMAASKRSSEVSGLLLAYLGQFPGEHKPLDLSESCRKVLSRLRPDRSGQVTLETDLPDTGPTVKGNRGQIKQVIKNLVLNAWEALDEKPGVVSLGISTVLPADIPLSIHRWPFDFYAVATAYACLEVRDTGSGLTEERIERLFDPFFTTKFTGRGLGLPVVLGSVQAHDGCITVESEPDNGTVFKVYLPLTDEKVVPSQTAPQTEPAAFQELGTVLLIEDEPSVRKMGKLMLSRLGIKVLEAQDGAAGLGVFHKHHKEIRCVLSDITMPRMTGWETIEALRRLNPDIPVILASGYDQAWVMEGAGSQLPQAFLKKPYSLEALKEALTKAMQAV